MRRLNKCYLFSIYLIYIGPNSNNRRIRLPYNLVWPNYYVSVVNTDCSCSFSAACSKFKKTFFKHGEIAPMLLNILCILHRPRHRPSTLSIFIKIAAARHFLFQLFPKNFQEFCIGFFQKSFRSLECKDGRNEF